MNMNKPRISIIVAMDEQRGIGKDNGLLWHIPEELKHFKEITMGHPIIMGRKTYESIGRPLPGRTNIVITRDGNYQALGCVVVNSLEEAIKEAGKVESRINPPAGGQESRKEIFITGGGQIFASALPLVDKLYITIVEGNFQATVFFPEYEHIFKKKMFESKWQKFSGFRFKFIELEK